MWKFEMVEGCKIWRPWGCIGYLDRVSNYNKNGTATNEAKKEQWKYFDSRWMWQILCMITDMYFAARKLDYSKGE